jgi:hypothetical protein
VLRYDMNKVTHIYPKKILHNLSVILGFLISMKTFTTGNLLNNSENPYSSQRQVLLV